MTDSDLIKACSEKVMGWPTVPFSFKDRQESVYPRLIENINDYWVLIPGRIGESREWNPLASIADAFELVDAMERYSCDFVLEKSGGNWTATFGGVGAKATDRRRAIVMACLAIADGGAK